jgi:hypothetical protein
MGPQISKIVARETNLRGLPVTQASLLSAHPATTALVSLSQYALHRSGPIALSLLPSSLNIIPS